MCWCWCDDPPLREEAMDTPLAARAPGGCCCCCCPTGGGAAGGCCCCCTGGPTAGPGGEAYRCGGTPTEDQLAADTVGSPDGGPPPWGTAAGAGGGAP